MKRDVFRKGNLLGIPSLLAQACVVAALPARLTGAGLPFGPQRAAAAAVTFSVSNVTKLPQYQPQMTFDSAYMAKVGVLRTGLCAGHPALKEILVSLVRGQLLARLTHVIDDDNAARYLESRTVEDATLRTAMSAGDTHLDAIGTSRDELLSNDVWSTRTQTFRYPPTYLLFQPCGERPWIQRKTVWCAVAHLNGRGTLCSTTAARGTWSTRFSNTL